MSDPHTGRAPLGVGYTMTTKSYTVSELAEAKRVSRQFIYTQWAKGKGPRYYLQGNRRRVTEEMRQEWHRELEAASKVEA
jgi:hypothetical protein